METACGFALCTARGWCCARKRDTRWALARAAAPDATWAEDLRWAMGDGGVGVGATDCTGDAGDTGSTDVGVRTGTDLAGDWTAVVGCDLTVACGAGSGVALLAGGADGAGSAPGPRELAAAPDGASPIDMIVATAINAVSRTTVPAAQEPASDSPQARCVGLPVRARNGPSNFYVSLSIATIR
jgi:hypothetical protein